MEDKKTYVLFFNRHPAEPSEPDEYRPLGRTFTSVRRVWNTQCTIVRTYGYACRVVSAQEKST